MAFHTPRRKLIMNYEVPLHTNGQEYPTNQNGNLHRTFLYSSTPESSSRCFENGFTSPHVLLSKIESPQAELDESVVLNFSLHGDNNKLKQSNALQVENRFFHKNTYFVNNVEDLSSVQNIDLQENVPSQTKIEDYPNVERGMAYSNYGDIYKCNDISTRCVTSHDSGFGSQISIISSGSSLKNHTIPETVPSLATPTSHGNCSFSLEANTVQKDSLSERVVFEPPVSRVKQNLAASSNEKQIQMDVLDPTFSYYSCSPVQDSSPFLNLEEEMKMDYLDPVFSDFTSDSSDALKVSSDSCLMFPHSKNVNMCDLNSRFRDFSPDFTTDFSVNTSDSIKENCTLDHMFIDSQEDSPLSDDSFSVLDPVFLDSATIPPFLDNDSVQGCESKVNLPVISTSHSCSVKREKLDFLLLLGVESAHPQIIERIFSYLEPRDLTAVAVVSKTWSSILKQDATAYKRAQCYLEERQKDKENCGESMAKKLESSTGSYLTLRRIFGEIQNLPDTDSIACVTTNPSPPVSPSKRRFYQFVKAGQKLENGKSLSPCPRCSLPSQVDNITNLGQCTREGCQFMFCTKCNCESHISSLCPVSVLSSQRSRKRPGAICSKQSKRNLRRL